jgi:DNA-binding PadR family transcriptional regulator
MENRLKGLRKSMEKSTFKQLDFTEEHRQQIREKMHKSTEKEEDIFLVVLQLLNHEQTGFELSQKLRSRGIQRFEGDEGFLYTLLHRLEQKGVVQSNWDHSGDKYYQTNNKGRKILRKAEKSTLMKRFALKELIQG